MPMYGLRKLKNFGLRKRARKKNEGLVKNIEHKNLIQKRQPVPQENRHAGHNII